MVLGKRGFSLVLLVFGVIISVYMVLLADPTAAQNGGGTTSQTTQQDGSDISCSNGEDLVETFSGNGDQTTDQFDITANSFRYLYEASSASGSGNISIEALDENLNTAPFSESSAAVLPNVEESSIDIDGPGTFSLEIAADEDVEYTIIVCERASPDDDQEPTNRKPPQKEKSEVIINVPNKPLPPTGGLPVYGTVIGFILAGAGLLGLGIGLRRGQRR